MNKDKGTEGRNTSVNRHAPHPTIGGQRSLPIHVVSRSVLIYLNVRCATHRHPLSPKSLSSGVRQLPPNVKSSSSLRTPKTATQLTQHKSEGSEAKFPPKVKKGSSAVSSVDVKK
ncbi:hypothetical protein AB6A40_010373 [Gnathostoma spinigerum]|uniref:Uncharacterized protein n=1 Tax=Gnathostoma spinigerum TaxID=75299 RepID=A0ABD6EZK8_9BILA